MDRIIKIRPFGLYAILLIMSLLAGSVFGSVLSEKLAEVTMSNQTPSDSTVKVVVFLEEDKANSSSLAAAVAPTRSARIQQTIARLNNSHNSFAAIIESFLNAHAVSDIEKFWITDAYAVELPVSAIDELSALDGVIKVVDDATLEYDEPIKTAPADALSASVSSQIELLNVPLLWQTGLTGKGRLVCSFDTGVESSHPALSSKWRGNHESMSESWFSVAHPAAPYDAAGHGTHTMGVMVGSEGADTIGVAPGAEWISAGVIDQGRTLPATLSDVLLAYQWALDPDGNPQTTDDVPDVILNSWGVPRGLFEPCDPMFATVLENVEAAGIVTIFSAGNEGPDPQSLRYPADMALTPLNTFSVGAVNNDLVIASFSSRGPSSCDGSSIKPELVAPGVSIRSSYKGGIYAYMSGTSMAAPFIAGIVALMRQYNPDATVEEIKQAFIASAIDLGAAGEDNAYGYGFVDAAKLIDELSPPAAPEILIEAVAVTGSGIAVPGESSGLRFTLACPVGGVNEVIGTLAAVQSDSVSVIRSEEPFYFGGGNFAVNTEPFTFVPSTDLYNGQTVDFKLYLSYTNGELFDSLETSITIGITPPGSMAVHDNGNFSFSVSDFAQFGLAPGSIYNVNGRGLTLDGQNLLYEAGMIVGRNGLQISSSVRDALGDFAISDFTPTSTMSAGTNDFDGGYSVSAAYADPQSSIPIPIRIAQQTTSYSDAADLGFLIMRFTATNPGASSLASLSFGLMFDFDLPGLNEQIVLDSDKKLIYQDNGSGRLVGLVGLENLELFSAQSNGLNKTGFTRVQLYEIIAADSSIVDPEVTGDRMFFVSSNPFTLQPFASWDGACALVVGRSLAELYANAESAKLRFDLATDVVEIDHVLPDGFTLSQNYPNPFNPTTTISMSMERSADISLKIYNSLGQAVRTLHEGRLPVGEHTFVWDGADSFGQRVASGVYFYRAESKSFTVSRKMLLLK